MLTEKLKHDVAANTAKIESANFDRPVGEFLDQIDFEVIADHCWRGSRATGAGSGGRFAKTGESGAANRDWLVDGGTSPFFQFRVPTGLETLRKTRRKLRFLKRTGHNRGHFLIATPI
ncbi:MAG TPA: hypothetical protein VGY55_12525, partial [Pirellulales bacterium]|nr:hypothetical protein [Pirellulales bacterium]